MRKKLKSLLKKFYKMPELTGIAVFIVTLVLTQYLTYKDYLLLKSSEKVEVKEQANLIEKKIVAGLSFAFSATKTLSYLERKYGIGDDFEEIAREIIHHNPNMDVLQLLEGGTIKYSFPFRDNEAIIGYDILADPLKTAEALKAIETQNLFFSGPFKLKQGGMGIVGRLPIFKNDKFWGFAAVVIRLETFFKIMDLELIDQSSFYVQFSKKNPETGIEEFFLPLNETEYTGFQHTLPIPLGDWLITVQLKESQAFNQNFFAFVLRSIFSVILGFVTWYMAIQSAILRRKVNRQSQMLKLSNERFEYATMATSDAVWDWNLKTDAVYRSDNFEKLFGYTNKADTEDVNFWDEHIHPDDQERVKNELYYTLQSSENFWEKEFRFLKSDGSYAHVVDKGIIIRDKTGTAIRLIGATQDISKIKSAELDLEKEKEFLKAMLENLSEGIVACDDSGKISLFNKASRNIFGLDAEDIEVSEWSEFYGLFKPDGITPLPTNQIPLSRAFQGERVSDCEIVIAPKNLSKKTVLCSGEEIRTTDGRILGAVVVLRDVTEKKENEKSLLNMSEELIKRAEKLEISNAELEQFAYIASHDLQEPLRMITSFLKLLEKRYNPILDEKGKQYIHFATDGAARMRQIIMDLLEYSRAGNNCQKEEFSLMNLLEDVTLLEKNHIKRLNAKLSHDDLLPNIVASKPKIRQLLQNLINNALKYTDTDKKPEIHVSARECPAYWEISIKDNGIGVAHEDSEKIFQVFQRLHSRKEYEGTGIGLAICKKIVENHQGKIWIESQSGMGSTVYFTIKKPN